MHELLKLADPVPAQATLMDLRVRVYDSLDELQNLRPAWDELLSHYSPATTFSTWEWLSSWWECFGKNRSLHVVAVSNPNLLIGLAPFSISNEKINWFSLRVLRLMGDGSNDSDNLDLPVRPGFEMDFAGAILQHLKRYRRTWNVCLLNTLPADSVAGKCLVKLLSHSSWTFFEYSSKSSFIPLPDSWDSYLETLSSEDRQNLNRYTRRIQKRYRTRAYRCNDPNRLESCLDALFRLHQGRWQSSGQPGTFSLTERRDFYALLSQRLLNRRWLELWALELDGEILAVQFAFRLGERVFQLQEGYDHNRKSDRLGFVLRGEVLKQLISERVRSYDFLGGEDSYKLRWGARQGHYRHLHFASAFGVGAAYLQFVDKASKTKERLRGTLPGFAWRALHGANLMLKTHKVPRTSRDNVSG